MFENLCNVVYLEYAVLDDLEIQYLQITRKKKNFLVFSLPKSIGGCLLEDHYELHDQQVFDVRLDLTLPSG